MTLLWPSGDTLFDSVPTGTTKLSLERPHRSTAATPLTKNTLTVSLKKYRSHYPNRRLGLIYVRHWDNFRKLNVFTAIYCSRQELQTPRPFFPPSLPFTLLWMLQLSCSFILSPISPSFNLKVDQYILTPFFQEAWEIFKKWRKFNFININYKIIHFILTSFKIWFKIICFMNTQSVTIRDQSLSC